MAIVRANYHWRLLIVTVLVVVVLGVCWLPDQTVSVDHQLRAAQDALEQREHTKAESLALQVLSQQPDHSAALLIAGSAAEAQHRIHQAVDYYSQIPDDAGADRVEGLLRSGELQFYELGRLSDSEQSFRLALEVQPHNVLTNSGLAYLLVVQGRRWEAVPHLFEVLRQDQIDVEQLCWLGVTESFVPMVDDLNRCLRAVPTDPHAMLGMAGLWFKENNEPVARELLVKAIAAAPDSVAALALLGEILLTSGTHEELIRWHDQLPAAAAGHPTIWNLRGRLAKRDGDRQGSIRCFLEAVRLNPSDRFANNQLAVALGATDADLAERFAQRAEQLIDYVVVVNAVRRQPEDVQQMQRAAELTESMGRFWEAWGWCRLALELQPNLAWAQQDTQRLKDKLTATAPLTIASGNPVRDVDLSHWPLPNRATQDHSEGHLSSTPASTADVSFEDVTAAAGIDFQYYNGRDPDRAGTRLHEVNGGGVAALDFDGDGWPDLCFTQGCEWPPRHDGVRHLDHLYRNLGNGRFQNVTSECGFRENGFSQGIAAGDIDNDGFPDVYIANIGTNHLYQNNGDGTLSDVTSQAGLHSSRWTSSCLIADLDGDTLPEIYDVNYVNGSDVFDRVCLSETGRPEVCNPGLFAAEPDELFANLGDGRFAERSSDAGIASEFGRGLGIVAADFDGSGRLSLFVANDVDRNFFFHNEAAGPGTSCHFTERAFRFGLAVDANGLGQACMGVAAGDLSGDGLLDLFITNFYHESNCLYAQQSDHSFLDVTRHAGLREPGYQMLGFGTQIIDGELDGLPDLVLMNGHLDDRTDEGIAYRMRPQYYRNLGNSQFAERAAEALGPFFESERLGRGLARLDWNRDGREDFAVSDLLEPAALVSNTTRRAGNSVAVCVRGVQSSRDAIGTRVTVTVGGRTYVRQFVAGDGYQSKNQQQLVFGIGSSESIDSLQIRWPSGREQSWSHVTANEELLILESRPSLYRAAR